MRLYSNTDMTLKLNTDLTMNKLEGQISMATGQIYLNVLGNKPGLP